MLRGVGVKVRLWLRLVPPVPRRGAAVVGATAAAPAVRLDLLADPVSLLLRTGCRGQRDDFQRTVILDFEAHSGV